MHTPKEPSLSGPVSRGTARLSQQYSPIARYGFLVSQHGQLGGPPFLSLSPWRAPLVAPSTG